MKKTKYLLFILGAAAFILLIGSFPIKSLYGQRYCDLMRIAGFAALLIYSVLTIYIHKKNTK